MQRWMHRRALALREGGEMRHGCIINRTRAEIEGESGQRSRERRRSLTRLRKGENEAQKQRRKRGREGALPANAGKQKQQDRAGFPPSPQLHTQKEKVGEEDDAASSGNSTTRCSYFHKSAAKTKRNEIKSRGSSKVGKGLRRNTHGRRVSSAAPRTSQAAL